MKRIPSIVMQALLAAMLVATWTDRASAQRIAACCTITAIDVRGGSVTAKVNASGKTFEFKPRNAATIATLRVGQAVQANFATSQVSTDGRTVCCTISRAPDAAVVERAPAPKQIPTPAKGGTIADRATIARVASLPRVTYGEPVPAQPRTRSAKLERVTRQTVVARVGGREVTSDILHLNGRQGIRNSGMPDGARRLLEMHVRKLPLGASQYYLVDPRLATEWAATHPVPPEVKPKEAKEKDSDCGTVSWEGVVDCGEDAVDAVEAEFERARKQAQDWWDESADKLAKEWGEAASCFADRELPGPTTPVKFSISPTMSVDMKQSGARGSAQGEIAGTVSLGIPMEADFQADMKFFYIPCLPFVFRPSRMTAEGNLTVGQQLGVDVTATGSFHKTFTIPPTGGPQIPLYVIPIVIGDVPVAVLDVSAYVEGEIEVSGEGKASGRFTVASSQRTTFKMECNGEGCTGHPRSASLPTTTSQSAQLQGKVTVQPGIYTALQLSFDYNVLQGRAGPQPYLLGVANGCVAGSVTQAAGSTSSASSAALTADVDWGLKLRAEGLAGGKRIGERWEKSMMQNRHIWYADMAPGGSSALTAAVTGPAEAVAGQPAAISVRMPACFPYTETVVYRISWSGSARPAPNPACQWQGESGGTCRFAPAQQLPLRLTWPSAGAHSVTVQLLRDAHRAFAPAPAPSQFTITVGAPGSGTGGSR